MGIVNRRNAFVGWAVLRLGKWAAKKKAKDTVPTASERRKGPAAVAAAIAAGVGVLAFWKRRREK